jgi:hypothetical protein
MTLPILPDAGTLQGTSAYYQIQTSSNTLEHVSFSNVQTKSIDVKPLMEAMKTDQIGTSVEISFTAIASYFVTDGGSVRTGKYSGGIPEFGALISNDEDIRSTRSASPTNTGDVERILRILSSNRGRFIYKIGQTILYDVSPAITHNGDLNSGYGGERYVGLAVNQTPIVEATVSKIIGNSTVYVDVKVKFDYMRCTGESNTRVQSQRWFYNVKSLRWYYADDIDATTWLTTRRYRGKLEVIDRTVNVQVMRYLVLPPLQMGFKRISINLEESQDGMSLEFEVVDQEIFAVPPWPVSDWDGGTTLSFPRLLIGKANVNCELSVKAPKWVRKFTLLAWAMRIVDAKIHWYNSISYAASCFTEKFSVSDTFKDNSINVNVNLSFILGAMQESATKYGFNPIWSSLDATFNNNLTYEPGRTLGLGQFYSAVYKGNSQGHRRGIKNYNPNSSAYWYPYSSTLSGIFRCALQHPCSSNIQPPGWYFPSESPQDSTPQPGTGQSSDENRAGGGDRPENDDSSMVLPSVSDEQESVRSPYTQYEIQTVMSTDMGIKTFSPMNNIKTLSGENASRIIHQSNAPTETVTMILDAKRLNRWPNGPNELSFKDEATGIYYICESVDTIASTAVNDALRKTVQYSLKAVVKYQLSRHHKHTEPKLVFTPPFLSDAVGQDPNLGNAMRQYYESKYSKSGLKFRPGGDEDNGATEPPPTDGGGGDTPIV